MKNRTKKYYIVRFISFLILLIMGLSFFSYILTANNVQDSPARNQYFQNIKAEGENTIDALFIGDSTIKEGIVPNKIWKDINITSYILGYGYATFDEEYYDLKKLFKIQKPKYVFLEASYFFDYNEKNSNICQTVSSYCDSYLFGEFNYYFPLMRYKSIIGYENNNIISLARKKPKVLNDLKKGYLYSDTVVNVSDNSVKETKNKLYLDENGYKYFDMYYNLCKENNCELILLLLPQINKWTRESHNVLNSLSKKYQVRFIDFNINTVDKVSNFSWKTDTKDGGGHLNYSGATKVTDSLEKYMVNELNMKPTTLSKENIDKWNKDTNEFYNSIK